MIMVILLLHFLPRDLPIRLWILTQRRVVEYSSYFSPPSTSTPQVGDFVYIYIYIYFVPFPMRWRWAKLVKYRWFCTEFFAVLSGRSVQNVVFLIFKLIKISFQGWTHWATPRKWVNEEGKNKRIYRHGALNVLSINFRWKWCWRLCPENRPPASSD